MQDQCTISHTNAIGVDLLSTPDLTGGNGVNAKPKTQERYDRPAVECQSAFVCVHIIPDSGTISIRTLLLHQRVYIWSPL